METQFFWRGADELFIRAALHGDEDTMRRLISTESKWRLPELLAHALPPRWDPYEKLHARGEPKSFSGMTALMAAVGEGHRGAALLILEHPMSDAVFLAAPNMLTEALGHAVIRDEEDMVSLLLDDPRMDAAKALHEYCHPMGCSNTLLTCAVTRTTAEVLLNHSAANPGKMLAAGAACGTHTTPLINAVQRGFRSLVELFVDHPAAPRLCCAHLLEAAEMIALRIEGSEADDDGYLDGEFVFECECEDLLFLLRRYRQQQQSAGAGADPASAVSAMVSGIVGELASLLLHVPPDDSDLRERDDCVRHLLAMGAVFPPGPVVVRVHRELQLVARQHLQMSATATATETATATATETDTS